MESKPLIPKLRFPEFRGGADWERKSLHHICSINPSDGDLPERFIYIDLESVEAGHLKVCNQVQRQEAPSRAQRLLKIGDVVFQIVRPYQRNNLFMNFQGDIAYVASTGYAQLRAHDSKEFLYQLVHTDGFVSQVISKCTGSSYPAINSSDLADIPVQIPSSPAEQQRIAESLMSLDELIAAERRKLETLRTYKKGLMQNLFPREGETTPCLRFPEFRDAGEWNERALESLVSPTVRRVAKPKDTYVGLGIRSHGKGTFLKPLETPEKNSMEFLYEVHEDDLIVNITFAWEGAIAIAQSADGGALVSHRFPTYLFRKSEALPAFFKYSILDSRLIYQLGLLSPGGAGRNRVLNKSAFLKIKMLVPELDEQRRIAGCLNSLDDLISNQAKRLNTLKLHKQGLMQGLFPSLNEVVA